MGSKNQNLGSVLKGNRVKAVYTESSHSSYRHNALIEALHPILGPDKAALLMRRKPIFDESSRLLPAWERAEMVQGILHYVEPLPSFIELESRFSKMIRNGYMTRNPIETEWVKQINSGFEDLRFDRGGADYLPPIRSNAAGCAIIGASGSGKTTAIESVLGLYDQVIEHSKYNGKAFIHKQLVWLKLECPSNGSTKALCCTFLGAVDEVLGTKYLKKLGHVRKTEEDLIQEMARIAALHSLGVLVIDELQRLNEARSGGDIKMMNFFVQLSNAIGVPVVLVGTFRALKLFRKSFSQARRATGLGDEMWTNMAHDDIWDFFLEGLWCYQWTKTNTPLTHELNEAMYEASQGIIDVAIKLYMLVQWSVIGHGKEIITPAMVRKVAKEKMKVIQPALNALKFGTVDNLEILDDLMPDRKTMKAYLKEAQEKVLVGETLKTLSVQRENESKGGQDALLIKTVSFLSMAGIDSKDCEVAARTALGRFAEDADETLAFQEAFRVACELMEKRQAEKERKRGRGKGRKKTAPAVSLSGDLRESVEHSGDKSPYDSLEGAGNMRPPSEFLEEGGVL
ncbi:MAG: ATP-binding protein [Desulfuromonas sp.]|uniref:ATP-binding protein n=1 Tax=Desulfuromonas sp. TaxID=892 RepID=UPI000CC628F3|nr:ATP-binding protein [Desulfuromonas sp.]PLX85589.1 MAG: ATP-binding protein [Desulfuromonas sp.]